MNDFNSIRLDKAMYRAGESFSSQLERLDPAQRYAGTPLGGLDAYQRQLRRFGIRVSGGDSDPISKFFSTADSAALFPEYVTRAVRQGMEESKLLPALLASTTVIDSLDYRTISTVEDERSLALADVMEGGFIPSTTIRLRENLVRLVKRGRMLAASYEAIKFQRLDLFTVALRQIGAYIAKSQLRDAVAVLLDGDGNQNAAPVITMAGAAPTYGDLLGLWQAMGEYELTTILASPDMALGILSLREFKSTATGADFQRTGQLVTPLGATLISSSAVPEKTVVGLDRRFALQMVKAGEVNVDYDKLIDCQLERAAVTAIAGFAKLFPEAAKVLRAA